MELTNEQYSQINRYAGGEMDEKEKAFFEVLLRRNEALAAELTAYLEIQSLCASAGKKMEDRLDAAEAEKKSTPDAVVEMIAQARRHWEEKEAKVEREGVAEKYRHSERSKREVFSLSRRSLLAAAVVAGIICAAAIFYLQKKEAQPVAVQPTKAEAPVAVAQKSDTPVTAVQNTKRRDTLSSDKTAAPQRRLPANTQKLFAAHYRPDTAPLSRDKLLTEALSFYKNGKFDQAAEGFEMAERALNVRGVNGANGPARFYVYYYLAQSHLAAGKHLAQSIAELKQAVKEAKSEAFKSKALWYLALAFLKKGDAENARNHLLQVTAVGNAYALEASELLEQLNGK